jgi:transglutaminase-like putative cysteine protease
MRIRISHATDYAYDRTARGILQHLRLTPRPHEGQHVRSWRIECDADVRLTPGEDAYGNVLHVLQTEKPVDRLSIRVEGEVETVESYGVVRGAIERLPPMVYLRDTALTQADADIRQFAADAVASVGSDPLARMHALNQAINREVRFDTDATHPNTSAQEALRLKRGVCQDMAHLFLSCARTLGVPARYVSGHLMRPDRSDQEAGHAWAEAMVQDLGWVGFDPANGVSPTESHVRVAIGLDYLAAAPVRGTVYGGGGERMSVRLRVADASAQSQSQA